MKVERKLTGMVISFDDDDNMVKQPIYEDVITEEAPWYIRNAPAFMVIIGIIMVALCPDFIIALLSFVSFFIVLYSIGKIIQLYWHEK